MYDVVAFMYCVVVCMYCVVVFIYGVWAFMHCVVICVYGVGHMCTDWHTGKTTVVGNDSFLCSLLISLLLSQSMLLYLSDMLVIQGVVELSSTLADVFYVFSYKC